VLTFIGIIQFCTFLINSGLGIVILTKDPKSRSHQAFALFALGSAGWILSLYVAIFHFLDALIAGRLTFFFTSILVTGLIWFTSEFLNTNESKMSLSAKIALFLGGTFAILSISPFMVYTAEVREGLYIFGTFNPITYSAWFIFFLGSIIFSLVRAWSGVRRSKGIIKNQYFAFATGATIFIIAAVTTNLLLPVIFNDFRWNSIGPVFTIFMIAFVAHAIISYRFLEIRWVIKKSFDFIFLWSFAFLIIFGFETLLSRSLIVSSINVLSSLALAVLFVPFANYVNVLTAKITSRGSYVYEDAVGSITELVHSAPNLETLLPIISEKMTEYFGFSKIAIAAFSANHPEQPTRTLIYGFDKGVLKAITPGIRFCEQKNKSILETSEINWRISNKTSPDDIDCDAQVLSFLKEWDASILVPFLVGDDMIGIMLLGEKKDGSVLSQRDHGLLKILQNTAAPAMANGVRFAEMKRLYTQVASIDKAKSEFISVVSHQFRTPLTAILWNSELTMEDKKLPKDDMKSISEIHQRAAFLNTTLNRIFDLLALENKQMTFDSKLVNLRDVVKSVTDEFMSVCHAKSITLHADLKPTMINGDEEKITSVVRTLVENACGYSRPHTNVTITLASEYKNKTSQLRVSDHGIGIPEEEQAHIFDKFYRTGAAKKAAPDGTGISLYLAKQFVEHQHGKIDVDSEEGKGSTFIVTFPMAEI
jgi:signal transduction histidine kinase